MTWIDRTDHSWFQSIQPRSIASGSMSPNLPTNQSTHHPPIQTHKHTQTQYSVGLLALEQHAEKTAAEGVVNFYNFCAGLSLIALGVLYFVMVRALNVGVGGTGVVVVRRICMALIS